MRMGWKKGRALGRWGVESLVFVFGVNESPDDGGMDVFSGGAEKGCEDEMKRIARREAISSNGCARRTERNERCRERKKRRKLVFNWYLNIRMRGALRLNTVEK